MQPFKLLSLPRIPREIIAQQMEKFDLLNLILTSKKTQDLTTFDFKPVCCRIYLTKSGYQIDIHFGWGIYLKWRVVTEESDRTDPHLNCREDVGSIVNGDMLLERNSKITAMNTMFTVTEQSDRFKVFQQVVDFLFAMFPCKIDDLHFDFNEIPEPRELIKWKTVQQIELVRIDGGTEQQIREFMDVVQGVRCFYLDLELPHGFEHGKLFTPSVTRLIAPTPWLSRDTFFRFNNSYLFTDFSSFQPADIIEYIQRWLNGGYSNLERMELLFEIGQQEIMFYLEVLTAFPWTHRRPFPPEPIYFKMGPTELVDLRWGQYLHRNCDGKMLNIVFTHHLRLYIIVWEGEQPKYTIPKEEAVYESINWKNIASIKKLSPRIFESDEDAEMEMELKVEYN